MLGHHQGLSVLDAAEHAGHILPKLSQADAGTFHRAFAIGQTVLGRHSST